MAVAHGAFCLSLVLYVCGVSCGATDPNLTTDGIFVRPRDSLTPPTVPVDYQIAANSNFSDHEYFYNPDLYGFSTVNLYRGHLNEPPHAEDGWDDERLSEDGAWQEEEDETATAFSKDKNDTVTSGRHDTVHPKDNSLLPNAEFMSNVSSPFSYDSVQSVSSVSSAKTPSDPGYEAGHDAGQESRNIVPSLNSDYNRTNDGTVTPTTPLPLSGEAASVSGFIDRIRNYPHSRDAEANTDSTLPVEPMQPLCEVTRLPLTAVPMQQDAFSGSWRSLSTPPSGDDPQDVRTEVSGLAGENEHGQFSPRYSVTCDSSVTLSNLSAVVDVTYKRRTVSL